jgi:hypothetical protein
MMMKGGGGGEDMVKAVVVSTTRTIWNILYRQYCSLKLEVLSGGDHCWSERRCTREKRPVARNNNNNNLDIIIHYNEKRTCMLTDVAILEDRDVIKKEAKKILKYKYFTTEYSACGT